MKQVHKETPETDRPHLLDLALLVRVFPGLTHRFQGVAVPAQVLIPIYAVCVLSAAGRRGPEGDVDNLHG